MSEGYIKLRRGIIEHIHQGKVTKLEGGVYLHLHLYVDYKTGVIWFTCGEYIARYAPFSAFQCRKAIKGLEEKGYIKRFFNGKGKPYDILINKYETPAQRRNDSEKKLIDTGQEKKRFFVVPANDSSTFKVSITREFPEEQYNSFQVRVLLAKDERARF